MKPSNDTLISKITLLISILFACFYLPQASVAEVICKKSIRWQLANILRLDRVISVETMAQVQVIAWVMPGERHKIFVEMR
jgi:hypothetical protein